MGVQELGPPASRQALAVCHNKTMRIVHVYTGDDGQSHFADLEIPEVPHGPGSLTDIFPATMAAFRQAPSGTIDYHRAPRRQLVVCLSGKLEVECGDGSKRVFEPGEVLLADDMTGQGHKSRDIDGPRRSVWIALPDDFDISAWPVADSTAAV